MDTILTTEEIDMLLKSDGFTMPSIKQPAAKTSSVKPKAMPKLPGISAPTKKNPINVAQQLKNPEVKDRKMEAAKEFLKFEKNGQWSLDKGEPKIQHPAPPASSGPKYHVHTDGQRITTHPMGLDQIQKQFGGVKALEAAGHKLVEAK
jgi:hypothetical protein